jgi:hypothetical protein
MQATTSRLATADDTVLFVCGVGPGPDTWAVAIDQLDAPEPIVESIDGLNSHGLEIGDRFYRVIISGPEPGASAELFAYDERGVRLYRRIDGMADPHGLAFDGEHLIIPCSATNEIWRLTLDGDVVARWHAPGQGDSWHVNGVHVRDGRLHASAFGKFATDVELTAARHTPTGVIFDVERGTDVATDLHCPHNPTYVEGGWIVCDSQRFRVVQIDEASGTVRASVDCGAWTRGLALTDDRIYVGLSTRRHDAHATGCAAVAVIDRATWSIVRVIELPGDEVTSLTATSRATLRSLRNGFRTNNYRVSTSDRRELFRLVGNIHPETLITPMLPLVSEDRIASVDVKLDAESAKPRQTLVATIALRNDSSRPMFSCPPNPVLLALSWYHASGETPVAARRAALPHTLLPHETLALHESIEAPDLPGDYRFQAALVQEWVGWLHDDAGRTGGEIAITVTARTTYGALRATERRDDTASDRVLHRG